ncbi:MAG: molybdate ABC transporter permease subunit [Fibrobacteres bacterium]|nr:molybdate ABC transporter permease subunit [Fibrobacterota bacterium]
MNIDIEPLLLSLKLASITTLLLFVAGVPLAYWLSRTRSWIRLPVQVLVMLPLVLPPTVLGFYLLLGLSPSSFVGSIFMHFLDVRLVFSFAGIVIGSIIFSLPFMVNALLAGFEGLPVSLREASQVLGKSDSATLFKVLLPNMKPAMFTGIAMTFAHTMGEFGVVLMIGGKIPGVTRVASMAVYDSVEMMDYASAHFYAAVLFIVSAAFLVALFAINRRFYRGLQ